MRHCFLVFFLLSALILHSQQDADWYYNELLGSNIYSSGVGGTFLVEDDQFCGADWNTIEETRRVQNKIVFEFNRTSTHIPAGIQEVEIHLDIDYWDLEINSNICPGDPANASQSIELRIQLDDDPTKTQASRAIYFTDRPAHKIEVEVQSIFVNNNTPISAASYLRLYGEMLIDRSYPYSCDTLPNIQLPIEANAVTDDIEVFWDPVAGAEEYDLEYSFYHIESVLGQDILQNQTTPIADFNTLFRHNTTRITTNEISFAIPARFPEGYVLCRVRSARYKNGIRETSKWTSSAQTNVPIGQFNGLSNKINWHESDLNWQSQVSYAEDGKNIPQVQYFDASLRPRQQVTRNNSNTEKPILIQEQLFDLHGRPAMDIMTAPTDQTAIGFDPFFAKRNASAPFTKEQLYPNGTNDFCEIQAQALDPSSGASNYFSSSNTLKSVAEHQFIPDAEGFPFSTTEYMPDLTGRPKRQGGVGPSFQIGQQDTKYFYAKPDQKELDRLFGNEVGEASHYLKHSIMDANGEISIQYLDAYGRTIATALAGAGSANTTGLSNNQPSSFSYKKDLLDNLKVDQYRQVSTQIFFIAEEGQPDFTYSMIPQTVTTTCAPTPTCYDCVYDVQILLQDHCGNGFNNGQPYEMSLTNIPLSDWDSICNAPLSVLDHEFSRNLPIGEYKITKTLSINQEALDFYLSHFLSQTTCLPDPDTILASILNTSEIDCDLNTVDCLNGLDSVSIVQDYILAHLDLDGGQTLAGASPDLILQANTLYANLVVECEDIECQPSECELFEVALLTDLTPGGDYARFDYDANGIIIADPVEPGILDPAFQGFYANCFASRAYPFIGPIDSVFVKENGQLQWLWVGDLTVEQFVLYWKDEWATTLLSKHPDYSCYQDCAQYGECADFDAYLLSIESFQEAVQEGLIDSTTCTPNIFDADPCFNCGASTEFGFIVRTCMTASIPTCLSWNVGGTTYTETFSDTTDLELYQSIADWMNLVNPGVGWTVRELYLPIGDGSTHAIIGEDNDRYGRLELCGDPSCFSHYSPKELKGDCLSGSSFIGALSNVNPSGCIPLSLEHLISNLVYCNGEMPCRAAFGKGCTADNDMAWKLYVSHYLALKKAELANNQVCQFSQSLVAGHPSFSNPGLYEATQGELDQGAQDASIEIQGACTNTCTANTEAWMARISEQCGLSPASMIYTIIEGEVYDVCAQACLADRPFGATSTPGDSTRIKDILESYLSTDVCGDCSPYIIDYPGTYTATAYIGAINASSLDQSDTCLCTNLTDLEACWQNSGVPLFSDYLNQFSEISIEEAQVQTLLSYCNSGGNCRFFDEDIILPPYLSCNTCIDCIQFEITQQAFDLTANCAPTSTVYWDKLRLYANHELGLNLSGEDYESFAATCQNSTDGSCERLCPNTVYGAIPFDYACLDATLDQAKTTAELIYQDLLDSLSEAFQQDYLAQCLDQIDESFYADGPAIRFYEYQYTLYYYDQAGNLVKTIPPNGVHPLPDSLAIDEVEAHRKTPDDPATPPIFPSHEYETKYIYNTLNQVVEQISPDAEKTTYWYDLVGRVVASQDGRQRGFNPPRYSYTRYDALSRIIEVGEKASSTAMTIPLARDEVGFLVWLQADGNASRTQVTRSYYDDPIFTSNGVEMALDQNPTNSRNRMVSITIEAVDDGLPEVYDYGTHYAYDVSGNIQTIVQELNALPPEHRFKRIDYSYDYISGKVSQVFYQKGKADQYTYFYEYDENNRLVNSFTSLIETDFTNASLWETECTHEYYLHGPLARAELGEARVQGCDYAYTLQGWIKGMNSSILSHRGDMGRDGSNAPPASLHPNVARDAVSYTLGYFDGDYKQIGGTDMELGNTNTLGNSLYNGNIRHQMLGLQGVEAIGYVYQYDQLHRLKGAVKLQETQLDLPGYQWNDLSQSAVSGYNYDANGNLLLLSRNTIGSGVPKDQFVYSYTAGTNRLQSTFNSVSFQSQNFSYDGSGNLTNQTSGSEVIDISWTPYGKVKEVVDVNRPATTLFDYDPVQNRIRKKADSEDLFYVRDATGNLMAVYELTANNEVIWKEQYLYAAQRLGHHRLNLDITTQDAPYYVQLNDTISLPEGNKAYELTNHLGNVLATISDRKTPVDDNNNGIRDYYTATLLQSNDYYPFGLAMSDRTAGVGVGYRMGFNGKEGDSNGEWGSETHYDYGFRIYNPSIGRFLSVDPLTRSYPMLTPYQFASNTPIAAIDLDGLECDIKTMSWEATMVAPKLEQTNEEYVEQAFPTATPEQAKAGTEIALGFVPYVAQAIDLKDLDTALKEGSLMDQVIAVAAFIPGGDFLKSGRKLFKGADTATEVATKSDKLIDATKSVENVDEVAEGTGGLVLQKMRSDGGTKMDGWEEGDYFLTFRDQGSPQANWKQNDRLLREEMKKGKPIKDSHVYENGKKKDARHIDPDTGKERGAFFAAERNRLKSSGWKFNSKDQKWHPPKDWGKNGHSNNKKQ